MNSKDYYEILGISKNASLEEIKKSFRALAMKYHPDKNQELGSSEKFKEIYEAYEVLKNPETRRTYDRGGVDGLNNQGFDFNNFESFDVFKDLFDNIGLNFDNFETSNIFDIFNFGNKKQSRNNLIKTTITFAESILGCEKSIDVTKVLKCETCNGSCAKTPNDVIVCNQCHGNGSIFKHVRSLIGTIKTQVICDKCSGNGRIILNKCSTCVGKGTVNKNENIILKIPSGVNNEDIISYNNENVKVDILIEVKPSENYQRHNLDLYNIIYVDPIKAILGGKIEIPTPYGLIDYNLSPYTQYGDKIKIPNHGIRMNNNKLLQFKNGNLYSSIKFVTRKYNSQEKEMLKKLSNLDSNEIIKHNIEMLKEFKNNG